MRIILGSQSPRRRELLASLIGSTAFETCPPLNDQELSFDGLTELHEIEERLRDVVAGKMHDVTKQPGNDMAIVICADTIVVANDGSANCVLGKPPDQHWQSVVQTWFQQFYSGQSHEVWTGFEIALGDRRDFQIVKTVVTMPRLDDGLIDWYIATGEPVGKAGGYGIQGQAAALIEGISGSLTNVIGLPLLDVRKSLAAFGVSPRKKSSD